MINSVICLLMLPSSALWSRNEAKRAVGHVKASLLCLQILLLSSPRSVSLWRVWVCEHACAHTRFIPNDSAVRSSSSPGRI